MVRRKTPAFRPHSILAVVLTGRFAHGVAEVVVAAVRVIVGVVVVRAVIGTALVFDLDTAGHHRAVAHRSVNLDAHADGQGGGDGARVDGNAIHAETGRP